MTRKRHAFPVRVLVCCCVAILALPLPATDALSEGGLVKRFSGQGDAVTEVFEVGDGWRVEWQVESGLTEVFLEDTESGIRSLIASAATADRGDNIYARGGEFFFRVRGKGSWTLEVYKTL